MAFPAAVLTYTRLAAESAKKPRLRRACGAFAATLTYTRLKKRTQSGAFLLSMAFPAGVEPTAFRLGGERSILLSYGNMLFVKVLYTMRFGKSSNFIPRGQFICGKFIFSPQNTRHSRADMVTL